MSRIGLRVQLAAFLALGAVGGKPAFAGPPVFTGYAEQDFSSGGVYVANLDDLSQPDVTLPTGCDQTIPSGLDIQTIWLYYDPPTDILYVGMETWKNSKTGKYVFAGDADGDGASGPGCAGDDPASFSGSESVVFYLSRGSTTTPDYIFGKGQSDYIEDTIYNDFKAAKWYWPGTAAPKPPQAFGTTISNVNLTIPTDPTPNYPHVEFTIGRLGELLGYDPSAQPVTFSYGGFMGDTYSTIPSDYAPNSGSKNLILGTVNFPDPRGSLAGLVTQHWTNGDPRDGDAAPAGVQLNLTGQFVKGSTSTKTWSPDVNGDYASYPGTNPTPSLRIGDYVMQIVTPFGYAVESTTSSHPTTPNPNGPSKVNVTIGLQENVTLDILLMPVDSDGDTIPDIYEEPNPSACSQNQASCLDTDGDGKPNYLDTDSDDDGLPDDVEYGDDPLTPETYGNNTVPNYQNPDSDGDGIHDGTEEGVTQPTADTSTTTTTNGVPNFIPDSDPSTTTDPHDTDTDDDGIDDGGEDPNHNGEADNGETDATNPDTDGDGIHDGTEEGVTDPGDDTDTTTSTNNVPNFVPDSDPTTVTDPTDVDTDDDGLADGTEDPNHNGEQEPTETDAANPDSDGDGVHDGTETGITQPTPDTDTSATTNGVPNYVPDHDPSTTTDPLDQDTDNDGITDGDEDTNSNGQADTGETAPNNPDTDGDGLQDGTEIGLTTSDVGPDTDLDTFQPDGDAGATTTNPLDDDTDDDGLSDGSANGSANGGAGEDVNLNGVKDPSETDPNDADTDNDCVQDGTELGVTDPQGQDTDANVFQPDTSPNTTSDPLNPNDNAGACPDSTPTPTPGPSETPEPTSTPSGNTNGIAMGGGGFGSCSTAPDAGGSHSSSSLIALLGLAGAFMARRRRLLRAGSTLSAGLIVLAAGTATAQTSTAASVEVQQFHPTEDLAGAVVTSGSTTLAPGHLAISAFANYAINPLVYVGEDGTQLYKLQAGVLGFDLVGGIGLLKGLELGIGLPATPYQNVDTDNPFAHDPSAAAFNDITLKLRWRLRDINKGLGIALEPKVWLPTGSGNSYTGGKLNAGAGLVLDTKLGTSWLGLNVGYRYRPAVENLDNLMVGSEIYYRLGLGLPSKVTYFSVDIFGSLGTAAQTVDRASIASKPLELMVAASRPLGRKWTGTLGLGTGIIAGYGTPDFRITLGFTYGDQRVFTTDRDGDGIPDDVDKCPDDPEDKDGFEDSDGCPDLDNDKDGILDKDDKCPNDPEDFDGFEDEDGCPDIDNDKDGILDKDDKCPNDPEDKDGWEDTDGCPDIDNDKDGILDTDDKCPNVPENFNGFEDTDGCPDVKGKVKAVDNHLQLGKIFFEWDKDIIRPQSSVVLDLAISAFKENPTLKVRIEGHTSSEGTEEHNQDLSERRAIAVKKYMVEHGGLDPNRFETKGLGFSQRIIQDDDTEEKRSQNRRIEWVILEY